MNDTFCVIRRPIIGKEAEHVWNDFETELATVVKALRFSTVLNFGLFSASSERATAIAALQVFVAAEGNV